MSVPDAAITAAVEAERVRWRERLHALATELEAAPSLHQGYATRALRRLLELDDAIAHDGVWP